jgi:hypothetical protein
VFFFLPFLTASSGVFLCFLLWVYVYISLTVSRVLRGLGAFPRPLCYGLFCHASSFAIIVRKLSAARSAPISRSFHSAAINLSFAVLHSLFIRSASAFRSCFVKFFRLLCYVAI